MKVPVGEVPSVSKMRFDVCYQGEKCTIEPHFCREWDEDGGCYGTNPDHGHSFEEACDHVAEWHESQAKLWRERQHHTCLYYMEGEENDISSD